MEGRNFFIVSVFLVFILLSISGMIFAQRVIDLDKVWGDMRVLGKAADDWSGRAVAYGDINSDGYMDIIIGAPEADPGGRYFAGKVYIIFGSRSPHSTIDLSTKLARINILGEKVGDNFGRAVASGDINSDGYDDIIIGAHYANPPGGSYAGETYVIFGRSFSLTPYTIDLNTQSADITICGDNHGDISGRAVKSGDINGDGYDDVIIGAQYADPPGKPWDWNAGETYVIFGSSNPPQIIDLNYQTADITICGDDADERSGWAVASGDINGDEYDDIIIGAYTADPPGGLNAGKTYVIFGFSPPIPVIIDLCLSSANITVCGDNEGDQLGRAVASGDINGDEYDDIILGALFARLIEGSYVGGTYVIFGSSSPPSTLDLNTQSADITIYGSDAGGYSGYAVTSGNVNGDSYDDVIICAPQADPPGGSCAGETYVVFGNRFPLPPYTINFSLQQATITVCGDDTGDWSSAVASGDINGDGYHDIIIGAYYADPPGGANAGETYLISGGGAFITAHGLGGKSWIKAFSLLGNGLSTFKAFGAVNSQGEVHLAVGDMDADSLDEIAAGQGEGAKSWVKFFEVDGSLISTFKAFGGANTNGELHLAIGNFDAETFDTEIAIAQGEGGQSWVKVFKADGTFIRALKAFGGANAKGEVHLATGDLNKDGFDEIITGTGESSISMVKIFHYWGGLIRNFKAFDSIDNPGGEVRLAVGNFDADPNVEIAAATGYNGGNKVRLFDKYGTLIGEFTAFGFGGNPNGDVQIATADIDNDGIDEIICGHGEGGSSVVKVFKPDGTVIRSFKAFGGVNAQGEVHLGKSNY